MEYKPIEVKRTMWKCPSCNAEFDDMELCETHIHKEHDPETEENARKYVGKYIKCTEDGKWCAVMRVDNVLGSYLHGSGIHTNYITSTNQTTYFRFIPMSTAYTDFYDIEVIPESKVIPLINKMREEYLEAESKRTQLAIDSLLLVWEDEQ